MKGYIEKVFLKYVHAKTTHPELTLYKHCEIKCGAMKQLIPEYNTIPDLYNVGVKII